MYTDYTERILKCKIFKVHICYTVAEPVWAHIQNVFKFYTPVPTCFRLELELFSRLLGYGYAGLQAPPFTRYYPFSSEYRANLMK